MKFSTPISFYNPEEPAKQEDYLLDSEMVYRSDASVLCHLGSQKDHSLSRAKVFQRRLVPKDR